MKKVRNYISCLASAVLLFSCGEHPAVPATSAPIGFSVDASATKAGAGSDMITTAELSAFGLFANYAADETSAGTQLFAMSSAERVYKSGLDWTYDDTKYWELNKYYRFRAYHPHGGSFIVNASNVDEISIAYQVGVPDQDDLLFAFASVYSDEVTIAQKVPMNFKHALSALEFRIRLHSNLPNSSSENITSFYLKGIHPTGVVSYTHEAGDLHSETLLWNIPSYFEEIDKFFEWTGNKSFTNDANGVQILDGDGVAFVIPQTVKSGKTKLFFTTESSGEDPHQVVLPVDEWEVGKKYTYTITLTGSSATVTLSIKDWEVKDSVYSIYL